MPLFGDWLSKTRKLQEEAYHLDYDHFGTSDDGATPDTIVNTVEYIGWNVQAAFHELVELQSETSWKPWQHDSPYANRDQIRGEAIDVLHFMANVLAAVGVTDEELDEFYAKKMAVNRDRQLREGGYHVLADGVKCRNCKRALDDVPASFGDPTLCLDCATEKIDA